MKKLSEKFPWLQRAGCGVLICALLLSICLPLMGMRSVEPDNPILQAAPQEITVLQAGQGAGHAGNGSAESESAAGSGGGTESSLDGDVEQPDPEAPDDQSGQDTEPESVPQSQPTRQDYAEASIGTNTDSNQDSEGEDPGDTGEADEELPLPDLDIGAVLTWYKYGDQAASIVCAPDQSVGKRVLLAQLEDGTLPYSLSLTGLDAQDAQITGVYFAQGNAVPNETGTRGTVPMSLPDGVEYQNYVFTVQAHAAQKNQKGETVETDIEFTFMLRLESGIDLNLQLTWQTLTTPAQATCDANSSVSRTIKSDTLQDGLFQYSFDFLGESARDAELVSVDYRTADGGSGSLSPSGSLQMAPTDGQDTRTYYLTATVRAFGQTMWYTFILTYEDGLDLQLQFTWYEKSVTAQTLLCDADKRAGLTVKHNQLQNSELLYKLSLKGKSAGEAQIVSAAVDGSPINSEKGSLQLQAAEGGATYTVLVTAAANGRTVTFTVTLRYQSDVRLEMAYTLTDPDTGAAIVCSLTCENRKTVSAESIYDDQLSDGMLPYQFTISGEDAANVTIQSVKCYQSGSGRTETLAASGSVKLLLKDGKTGSNTFTVTAVSGSETYAFTLDLPYKHRGEQTVEIVTNHDAIDVITVGTDDQPSVINLTVDACTKDAQGNVVSVIRATSAGGSTKMNVALYLLNGPKGSRTGSGGTADWSSESGTTQHYTLLPSLPKNADGDTFYYELYIYAEDEKGNWNEKSIYLMAKRSERGQKTGKTAQIYIDMSVLGLPVYGPVSYDILSGEPLSYVIAKVVLNQDVPAPFDKPHNSFPSWSGSYNGSLDIGFYLSALEDGSGLVSRAKAISREQLSGGWDQFSSLEEAYAWIDSYFGAGSDLATLWRCLRHNNVRLNYADGSLGEFDFTDTSGWMYSLSDGSVFYPGEGLSEYYFSGSGRDVLTIRYTLACGWDIGDAGIKGNNGAGYCITCVNGQWSGEHHFDTPDKNGTYVCSSCGTTQSCPHKDWEWSSLDDETHQKKCKNPDCGELFGSVERHTLSYTPDETTHTAVCSDCGYTAEAEAHRWGEVQSTATCTEPGTETKTCLVCGYTDTQAVEPKGHNAQSSWESTRTEHFRKCRVCLQKIEGTSAPHSYLRDGYCAECDYEHSDACPGEIRAVANGEAGHRWSCSVCDRVFDSDQHDTNGENGACSVCGYSGHVCEEHKQYVNNGDGTHKVICSVCQKVLTENEAHTYANGLCACGAIDQTTSPTDPTPDPNPGGDDGGNPGGDDGGNAPGGDDGGDDSGSGGAGGNPGGGSDSGDDGSGDTGGEG